MNTAVLIALIAGSCTVLGGALSALINARVQRRKTAVEAQLTERRDTIADRDDLISGLRSDVTALKAELKDQKKESEEFRVAQRVETAQLRTEVQQVRVHNSSLITWVFDAIAVFRKHDLLDEMPKPLPDGVSV